MKSDFLKVNSQHSVPVLNDDGFILTESRAIIIYLIEKYYPEGHSLYPKGARERALINQYLQFDAANLSPRLRAITLIATFVEFNLNCI